MHAWLRVIDEPAPTGVGCKLVSSVGADGELTLLAEYRGHGQYAVMLGHGRGDLADDFAPHPITLDDLTAKFERLRAVSDIKPRLKKAGEPRQPKEHSGDVRDWDKEPPTDTADVLAHAIIDGRLEWTDVLPDGWECVGKSFDDWTYWLRPDADSASSANGAEGRGTPSLTVHSSSVEWAEPGESYSPADVLARGRLGTDHATAMKMVEDATVAWPVVDPDNPLCDWPDSVLSQVRALRKQQHDEYRQKASNAESDAGEDDEVSSFEPIDLGEYLDGEVVEITPDLLMMTNGKALLYGSRLNEVHGDSGTGKTMLVVQTVAELLAKGSSVMVVDIEDSPAPLIQRLRQIGVTDDQIRRGVVFIHPTDAFGRPNVDRLVNAAVEHKVAHVFIDSLGEAFSLNSVDENNDNEVGPWIRNVSRRLIQEAGCGVTHIDHITKSADNPLHPSGSKRKRAAITGVSWYMHSIDPFDIHNGGRARLRCGKDRHGNYKRGEDVADLVMTMVSSSCFLKLEPMASADDRQHRKEEALVRAVVDAVRACTPDWLSLRSVRDEVTGRNAAIGEALDTARNRGHIEEQSGSNRAREFRFVRAYADPWIDDLNDAGTGDPGTTSGTTHSEGGSSEGREPREIPPGQGERHGGVGGSQVVPEGSGTTPEPSGSHGSAPLEGRNGNRPGRDDKKKHKPAPIRRKTT